MGSVKGDDRRRNGCLQGIIPVEEERFDRRLEFTGNQKDSRGLGEAGAAGGIGGILSDGVGVRNRGARLDAIKLNRSRQGRLP